MVDGGIIRVEREATGWRDRARAYRILVDGRQVGEVKNGGVFDYPVESGSHRVRLKIDWCGSPEIDVEVVAGKECLVRTKAKPMRNGLMMLAELFRPNEYIVLEAPTPSKGA